MHDVDLRMHLRIAYCYATTYSHDNSTHVGAKIVGCRPLDLVAANVFSSRSQNIPENLIRERKYPRIVHAERAVIYLAAKKGISLYGATMICPWATCPECAQAIVASGIIAVYAHKDALDKTPERWRESLEIGMEVLRDGGVEFHQYAGKLGDCTNLLDGEVWYP